MSKKIKTQAIMSAQSRAEVVDNIAQMGALQREILRLNAELNDQITPLKQACDEKVAKLQAQINVLSESCHIWCEANRAELTDNHRVKFRGFVHRRCEMAHQKSERQYFAKKWCGSD